jgi:RNA recognition motif-containing protein
MRSQHLRGNVFVANLPPDLTDDELAEAFDPFGIVLSAFIARDPETGKRLRYGFVDIATERAARLAIEAMNGVAMGGHHLDVRMSEPSPKTKKRPALRPETGRQTQRATARRVGNLPVAETPARPVVRRRQPTFQVEHRSLPRRV